MIVELRPLSSDITRCQRELADCRWMPLKEYADHELVNTPNRFFARTLIENRAAGVGVDRTEMTLKIKDFERRQQVYSLVRHKDGAKL